MANELEKEKEALRQELRQMIAQGVPQEDIVAHRDAKLAEIEGKQLAAQQAGATAQPEEAGVSSSAPGSSELPDEQFEGAFDEAGFEADPIEADPELGAWKNFTNNVENVWNRILGFDDRLTLATVDVMEEVFGEETADKIWSVMPAYDVTSGEWLDSSEEVRANAYRELAQTEGRMKQTLALTDEFEQGDVAGLLSAAAGAGLNMMSTLVTSGLTGGAGLYTDMIGDAIYDANVEKAKANGVSVQQLYDDGNSEFMVPAAVGVAGGLLERLGALGVGKYIKGAAGKVAGESGKKAMAMLNNMGTEGVTEWLQTGLEVYNSERGKGKEDAAGLALDAMFSREGLEAALQGAVGAGVGGGAGRGARYFANKGAERLGLTQTPSTEDSPTVDMSEAAQDEDYLFDAREATKKYKSHIKSVEEAQSILEQDFAETSPEQRDAAREVIQEEDAAKKAEEKEKRYFRQLIQDLNDEYDGTVQDPTETGRIAYVAKKLGEQEGINTFDEALALTRASNRDALHVINKAFMSARTPQEAALIDDINANLESVKKSLEVAEPGPARDALQTLVDDYNADLANIFATANRKVMFADPVAVGEALEASNEIADLQSQEDAIKSDTSMPDNVKERLLANIEDKRAFAIEKGEVARTKMEESSSKNVEGTDTNAQYFEEVLKEEALENTKSTDDLVRTALGLNIFEDPAGTPVIDETLSKNRQPIDVVDGVKHYGKRMGGSFPTRAEALQSGKEVELDAKAKGYKTDVTYTDINPERAGGETTVEIEIYKPREQDLSEAVESLKNQEQGEEGAIDEAGVEQLPTDAEAVQEQEAVQQEEQAQEPRTELDYLSETAAQYGAEVAPSELGEGAFIARGIESPRQAHRLVGGLKKRGHKDAKFIDAGDGNYIIRPGKRSQGPQIDYSLTEDSKGDVAFNLVEEADQESAPTNFQQHNDLRKVAGNRIKLNIGLENNPIGDIDGIVQKLQDNPKVRLGTTEQVDGEYNGQPERTVVVDAKFDGTASEFRKYIEGLNKDLTQEAIGVKFNGKGSLIYDPDYKGEKYKFDQKFFKDPKTVQKLRGDLQTRIQERSDLRSIEGKEGKASRTETPASQALHEKLFKDDFIAERESEGYSKKEAEALWRKEQSKTPQREGVEGGVIQEATKALADATDEKFASAFDRHLNNPEDRRSTLKDDIGPQPKVDESFVDFYNEGKVTDSDFIKSIANYVVGQAGQDKELQGFAIQKLVEQVKKGNFKNKTVPQVFTKAKAIARGAKQDQRKAYGENVRAQRIKNVARRAEQAFYAEEGYEPDSSQLADFINKRKDVYKMREEVTPKQIEDSKFEEVATGVEAGGVQGAVRDIAQTRAAKEAGLDQLTDAVLSPELTSKIDSAVSGLLAQSPVVPTEGKGRTDLAATKIKKAKTHIDRDVASAISKALPFSAIENNLAEINDLLNLPQKSWAEMSKSDKESLKRKIVKGLAQEAEQRLGKQTTPSRRSDFSLEEGIEDYILDAYNPLERANSNYIKQVTDHLKKAWPGITIASTPSELKAAASELDIPVSMIKGAWVSSDNKVLINPDMATYDTPIHEFAHIWARQLQRQNPELWKRGVELLKGSKYMRKVDSIPAYRNLRKTGQLSRFYEEVMANAIGKRGYQIYGSQRAAGKWDNWMKKFGDWIKNKLGIKVDKPYDQLTLNDWIDVGVHGVFSGNVPVSPTSKNTIDLSLVEDPSLSNAHIEGIKSEGKWWKPNNWIKNLVPPAADDYHGLIQKLKGIVSDDQLTELTDTFVDGHQAYAAQSTKVRESVKKANKALKKAGLSFKKGQYEVEGNKVPLAQAIQAKVNGHDVNLPAAANRYIETMKNLGILKPSERYDTASPQADVVEFIANDLYRDMMGSFADKKNEVFSDQVKKDILSKLGPKYATALDTALQRMTTGKNSPGFSDKTTGKWNDWVLGSVGNIMFLNGRSAALQLLSIGNYMSATNSPGKFMANFFDPSTYKKAVELYNSDYLKERRARAGFDVNASEMMDMLRSSNSFSEFTKKALNFGFRATSFVDSVTIAMGGAALMKANGGDTAANRRVWIEQTEESQQSSRPDRVSQWQTSGVSKYVLAFANTPQQYFRLVQKASRQIRAVSADKSMSPIQKLNAIKGPLMKIAYYGAIQNLIFSSIQGASSALLGFGDSEDDDEERDLILGAASTMLRGMGLYGAVIDTAKNIILEGIKQEGKANPDHVKTAMKATGISPPLNRKLNQLRNIGNAYKYRQYKDIKHARAAAQGIAFATNLPTDWIEKYYHNINAIRSDKYKAHQELMMILGWTEWNFKDKNNGGFDFDDLDLDLEDLDLDLDLDI